MTLKEIRKYKGLTQSECASYLGISLRSYKSYENDLDKKGTTKYNIMCSKIAHYYNGILPLEEDEGFLTDVIYGSRLQKMVEDIKEYKKRDCYKDIHEYIYSGNNQRVLILYGLRRTGKTTLIKQLISEMNSEDFKRSAIIQIKSSDTLREVNKDLKLLEKLGYKYVFVDEVTKMDDFIEGAALFSDVFVACGMKIVLSGTDSLSFMFTKHHELYDRCVIIHTTFIPYYEFENVLGIKGIDKYIEYGGTMSVSGKEYNNDFHDEEAVNEYVDSAIAHNIQHSLKNYQYEGHFRSLFELYEKKELTNAINRVVEDINHRFTVEVLTKKFKSNDLSLSSKNLRKDKVKPLDHLDNIDKEKFTENYKFLLEILDKNEQKVKVDESHAFEIKEYLRALDLLLEIDTRSLSNVHASEKKVVISQPGLRYSQALFLVQALLMDKRFSNLEMEEMEIIISRILSNIKGRMLEDIVLLESKIILKNKEVFKLFFDFGEYDMVILDKKTHRVDLYEIKYNDEIYEEQYKHLIDEEKNKLVERYFGKINKRFVLYRGKTKKVKDIQYLNVEEYLLNLK